MTARFRVKLSYDGTDFSGSQFQPDRRTVQGELESALRKIGWQAKSVLFAGRTDAGVHASGQVVAFDLDWGHSIEELNRAVNAVLPPDISAREIQRTRPDFHPRYEARSRTYRYRILNTPVRDPLRERYCWRIWPELDLRRMKKASRDLPGTHDFSAFGKPHQPGGSPFRIITRTGWSRTGDELDFEITGNAFLYHMVRSITAALVKIGQGEEPAESIRVRLENPQGGKVQGLAPARGLVLIKVKYQD